MDSFKVRGATLNYDALDLDEMERYFEVTDRISEAVATTQKDESSFDRIRRACSAVLDGFDELFGAGTAHDVFGDRINVKEIMSGYGELTNAVNAALKAGAAEVKNALTITPRNRAERRASGK